MTNKTRKILLLPGDGIGPEVIAEVRKILEWMNKVKSLDFVLKNYSKFKKSVILNKKDFLKKYKLKKEFH